MRDILNTSGKFLVAALAAILFSTVSFAQYRQDVPEHSAPDIANPGIEDLYRWHGQGMHDTGKALMYSGAAFAMTGIALWTGWEIYDARHITNPENTGGANILYFIAGGAAGAVLALAGLPFLGAGRRKMNERVSLSRMTSSVAGLPLLRLLWEYLIHLEYRSPEAIISTTGFSSAEGWPIRHYL